MRRDETRWIGWDKDGWMDGWMEEKRREEKRREEKRREEKRREETGWIGWD